MGMRKISQITRIYKNNAQGNMPVMLIQNGSMQNEKRVTGTINNIEQEIRTSGLSSPAVIIIGKILQEALPIVSSNRIITENLKHEEQKVNGEFSYAKQYENDTEQFISRFY
jgi:siroheme synthase